MSSTSGRRLGALTFLLIAVLVGAHQATIGGQAKQELLNRKSIVFDLKTPKVFYCPQEKPTDMDKMIVKARPLDKLCEFDGKARPKNEPSDCYGDVDETEFACDEKRRFMIRLDLAAEVSPSEGLDDLDYIMTKSSISKKKVGFKKY